jgi:hypothetical protein
MKHIDKQLRMIHLTETIDTSIKAIKKIDFDDLGKAAKSKNPIKILRHLRMVPNLSVQEVKDVSSRRVKNFDVYYNHAMVSWKGKDVEVKKALASLYAIIKSLEREIPFKLRKTVVIFSKKFWIYSEGVAVNGITLKFVLWLISVFLVEGAIPILLTGGMVFAGYLFYAALALSIIKWLVGRIPGR